MGLSSGSCALTQTSNLRVTLPEDDDDELAKEAIAAGKADAAKAKADAKSDDAKPSDKKS